MENQKRCKHKVGYRSYWPCSEHNSTCFYDKTYYELDDERKKEAEERCLRMKDVTDCPPDCGIDFKIPPHKKKRGS